jgi:CubicO group peptidase (beta-lactamase class C family)
MNITALCSAGLIACATLGTTAHADAGPPIQAVLDSAGGTDEPGCAAGVFRAGEPVFTGASGFADLDGGAPLAEDTLFYAASVSKQFTVLAVVLLAVEGRLDLDDEIGDWIPELPEYDWPVTVRQMIHHTSGLRDSLDLIRLAGIESAARTDIDTALALMHRQQGLNFVPGTRYSYSNGGYLLLAELVERVTGRPFHEYAQSEVLEPLGMTDSFFLAGPPPAGVMAHGYVPSGDGFEVRNTFPAFSGSGGLVTSVSDMARYEQTIASGGSIWSDEVAAIMLEPARFNDGSPVEVTEDGLVYAGGIMVGERRGQSWQQHTGSSESFRAVYGRLPDRELGIVILCNRSDAFPLGMMDAIAEAVEGETFPGEPPAVRSSDFTSPPNAFDPAPGRYRSEELDAEYEVHVLGNSDVQVVIHASWPGQAEPARVMEFSSGEDGALMAGGTGIVFSEGGSEFFIHTARSTGIRFTRIESEPASE